MPDLFLSYAFGRSNSSNSLMSAWTSLTSAAALWAAGLRPSDLALSPTLATDLARAMYSHPAASRAVGSTPARVAEAGGRVAALRPAAALWALSAAPPAV